MLLENKEFVSILNDIKKYPESRLDNYIKLSPFFKALTPSEILKELDLMWSNILSDKSNWVGSLFAPQEYKRNKEKDIYLDILFPTKEAFVWAILYPNEVKDYYKIDKNEIVPTETPKTHLFEKEYKVVEKVKEHGLKEYIKTKMSLTEKYRNGFTGAQMQAIFEYLVVGKFEAIALKPKDKEQAVKKAIKPQKKIKK